MIQLIGLIVGLYKFTRLLQIASARGRVHDGVRILAAFVAIITLFRCIEVIMFRTPSATLPQ